MSSRFSAHIFLVVDEESEPSSSILDDGEEVLPYINNSANNSREKSPRTKNYSNEEIEVERQSAVHISSLVRSGSAHMCHVNLAAPPDPLADAVRTYFCERCEWFSTGSSSQGAAHTNAPTQDAYLRTG